MKKEILFRGRKTDSKEWVYGYYYYTIRYDAHFIKEVKHFHNNNYMDHDSEVDPATIGRWIGEVDQLGIKIFEDDVLGFMPDEEDKSKCLVIFKDGCFKRSYLPFLTEEQKKDDDFYEKDFVHAWNPQIDKDWIVIGNIHDKNYNH